MSFDTDTALVFKAAAARVNSGDHGAADDSDKTVQPAAFASTYFSLQPGLTSGILQPTAPMPDITQDAISSQMRISQAERAYLLAREAWGHNKDHYGSVGLQLRNRETVQCSQPQRFLWSMNEPTKL
jgi:hypothetical protein